MKTTFKLLLNVLFAILAVAFIACHGDQGEIGPKGDQGDTGTTGSNGTGFDELTQYGNIEVTFAGTRLDEVAFTETLNFAYMPSSGVLENSSLYKYNEGDFEFFLGRENKGLVTKTGRVNDGGQKNNVWFDVRKNADGIYFNQLVFYTDIVTDDFKTFEINFNDGSWDEGFQNPEVTNFSYNATTGKLIFNFSYTIPSYYSSTGNDITITGKVNVTVFERMNMPG